MNWQLWQPGPIDCRVNGISPLLASWEKNSHPAQVRLRAYLDEIIAKLSPLPDDVPLYLQLEVDVQDQKRLLRHYDLENYLTPLFGSRFLPSGKFYLVMARKFVGGGSRIAWGRAIPAVSTGDEEWPTFMFKAGRSTSDPIWKERIRAALAAENPGILAAGPVRVRIAWRCSARRNLSSLWKPTGDAMGPVLGVANENRPYHLNDDRIVNLEFHRNIDNSLGNDVEIGMWWKLEENQPTGSETMTAETFQTDEAYQQWRAAHPHGFVINTMRRPSPSYMVLHRASCTYVSEPSHEKEPGGFTQRSLTKIAADDIDTLRDWVAAHGRQNRTFSSECSHCKPTSGCD